MGRGRARADSPLGMRNCEGWRDGGGGGGKGGKGGG